MTIELTEAPADTARSFLGFPLELNLDALDANIAILGIPYGMPYSATEMANDQSRAPDAIRQASDQTPVSRERYDWDLGGSLLDGRDVSVVDCGNVTADRSDHKEHYRRAQTAAKKIFHAGATLVTLGGDTAFPFRSCARLTVLRQVSRWFTSMPISIGVTNRAANRMASEAQFAARQKWTG